MADYSRNPDNLPLTKRHIQIMCLVCLGDTDKEIGNKLGISYRTVGRQLCLAYPRLHAKNRTHAAVIFTRTYGL